MNWTDRISHVEIIGDTEANMFKKRQIVLTACATFGLISSMPACAADPEVEALKQELAAQRKLIEQLLANQNNAAQAPRSPDEAVDVERRLRSGDKGPIGSPVATAVQPGGPVFKAYGVADVSINEQNTGAGPKVRFDGGGGDTPSRLGFQVTSSISNVKVTAVAEAGLQFNNGSTGAPAPAQGINVTSATSLATPGTGNQVFSRQIWAGVDAGFGQISIGRQYAGSFVTLAAVGAAHGDGLYGSAATFLPVIGGMGVRFNNSLVWQTPQVADLRGILVYTAGSENNLKGSTAVGATSTNSKAGQGYDLSGIYAYKGGQAAMTTWNLFNTSWVTNGETSLAKKKGYQFAANYDFGPFALFGDIVHGTISGGNYQKVTKTLSDATGYSLSTSIPFGRSKVIATWTRLDDKSLLNKDGSFYGLSYLYELLPNTTLYASTGKMQNNRNASYGLSDSSNVVGNVTRVGFSPTGTETGVNYRF